MQPSQRKILNVAFFACAFFLFSSFAVYANPVSRGKVLIVLTSTQTLDLQDGKTYNSPGYYLDELSYPLQKLTEAGYEPVFATAAGKTPHFDPFSANKLFFNNSDQELAAAKALIDSYPQLQHPEKLSALVSKTDQFTGILILGGFGPMQDLVADPDLGKILLAFHDNAKPTGLICHGPVTLISVLPHANEFKQAMVAGDYPKARELAQGWPYAGYRLTIFSPSEELMTRQLNGKAAYIVSHALAEASAHVDFKGQAEINVIEDRELVTGQQPF